MFNFLSLLAGGSSIDSNQLTNIVQPLLDICSAVVPVLLTVVGAIGAIWCILLGVKYARADDPQEHEKAKNGLKNAIIGFVLIFVLLIALDIAVYYFKDFWINYERP